MPASIASFSLVVSCSLPIDKDLGAPVLKSYIHVLSVVRDRCPGNVHDCCDLKVDLALVDDLQLWH